jgi:hypothetical protein
VWHHTFSEIYTYAGRFIVGLNRKFYFLDFAARKRKIYFLGLLHVQLGPVVQRWVSANPVLKFNLLFLFVYFCTSVYFKTSEKKTPIDPDKISEEIFPNS